MALSIRFAEIIEEIKEDLELQAGLVLDSKKVWELTINRQVFFTQEEIRPYLAKIKEYLVDTESDDRVWECYQVLSSEKYLLAIHIQTQFIDFDSTNLTA